MVETLNRKDQPPNLSARSGFGDWVSTGTRFLKQIADIEGEGAIGFSASQVFRQYKI
ncbi:MAG: hypothetical protein Kow00121_53290 [Elainellaceae cyanobacterium]